jgi:hypothetical protein
MPICHWDLVEPARTTDNEDKIRFRGFAGNYSITVTAEGLGTLDATIHVQEQVENPFSIRMNAKTAPATTTTTEGRRTIALTSTLPPSTVTPSYAFALSQQQVNVTVAGVLVACLAVGVAVTIERKKTR